MLHFVLRRLITYSEQEDPKSFKNAYPYLLNLSQHSHNNLQQYHIFIAASIYLHKITLSLYHVSYISYSGCPP